ncbi:NWD2-like protein [Mya arenaria]|uniref:NWD2-like protein n=1 Tax=Mya arenaria TaxID=6604 RepID=A0ABY7EX81_MYAAR|nr:NWD2-like protein [Mya arenaria]
MGDDMYNSILHGSLNNLPTLNSRLVRIFVSSTFTDTREERNVLLEEVYPNLKSICKEKYGMDFQTFLNQKHGFRPLQASIVATEFQMLCDALKELGKDTSQLKQWYKKDENQVPPVYILQPISTYIPGYRDKSNQSAREEWDTVFNHLRENLRTASRTSHQQGKLSKEDMHKYYMSVTEAEIASGILRLPDSAADHCLCFVRIIEDITNHLDHSKAWRFIDVLTENQRALDNEAQTILGELRDDKIVKKLNNFNISSMVAKIDAAVNREKSLNTDEIYIEVLQHLSMARERCEMFHGREEILEMISEYLHGNEQQILVLYGQSGCGKTSIMAQTIKLVAGMFKSVAVVVRFLGTSPHSSNLWRLLRSLCEQITACYGKDKSEIPEDFDDLKDYFLKSLKFATPTKPLVLILDSLDQLTSEHNSYKLHWLPRKLPANVRFLVSTYTEASNLLDTLRLVFSGHVFVQVPVFSQVLSTEVLTAWLKNKKRTLTKEQFGFVEEVFKKCSLPLFVKLTYDQVLLWKSYTPSNLCQLSFTVQQSIQTLFSQLEKKHGVTMVTRSLSYVTASASGISETELEDLLSLDDTVLTDVFQIHIPPLRRIPPLLWVRIRHDISQYLVDKEVDEVRSFFWYHRQFFETAKKRYLSDKVYKQEIHSLMADYYLGKWYGIKKPFRYTPEQMKKIGITSPDDEADRKISAQPLIYSKEGKIVRYNKRKLNKLPYHLYKANRAGEVRSVCLFNYNWLLNKIKAVSLQDVLLDYTHFGENNGIIHKALKAGKSTLKLFPETIAIELCGRLLALLQTKTEKHETKLLEDSMQASAKQCRLVPYVSCYTIPSQSELYSIENSQVPVNAYISDISSESSHFATLAEQNTVMIWDSEVGELETTVTLISTDEANLNVMKKPSGKDVVIVGTTHQEKLNPVFVVNINNGEVEHRLMLDKLYKKIVFNDQLHFSVTDKLLLVHVNNQAADVFDLKSSKLLHEFDGEPDQAIFVAMDTMLVLHPTKTNFYKIYRSDTFELVHQVNCKGTPKSLFINDKTTLGCVVMENLPDMLILNLEEGSQLGNQKGHVNVASMSKTKNQRVTMEAGVGLVTSLEGFLVFDVKSLKKLREIKVPDQFKPRYRVLDFDAVLTPDQAYIIAGYDRHLIVWETKTGKLVDSIEATRSRISHLKISPDGKYVIQTNGRNNQITAWSVEALKKNIHSYKPLSLSNSARYMCVNREGTVAVTRSINSTDFSVIDVIQGTKRCDISHDFEGMCPFVTEDGIYAVIREYNSENCLKVWDTVSGEMVSQVAVSSLYLKAYILGTKPENMVVMVENDATQQNILTFYNLPSATETGISVTLGKYNMLQIFFADHDKYLFVGIEEHTDSGVKIYTKGYSVSTGKEIMVYPKMHPKKVQMITPDSDCIMGQRIHVDKNGKESWELAVLKIETGDAIATCRDCPESVLYIGNKGQYGIDRKRFVYDIKKGKRLFQFDPECEESKSTPKPKLTKDEKLALWIDMKSGLVKLGNVETQELIGMAPTHSLVLNLEVTPKGIILVGCEDGRIMLLQIVDGGKNKDALFHGVFTRSMKRGLQMRDSLLQSLKPGKKIERAPETSQQRDGAKTSKTCSLL